MKLHLWLVRNDEKRGYFVMRGKNQASIRRRLDSNKETLIGREDKIPSGYKDIFTRAVRARISLQGYVK